ncbi:MAG TPA: hypothetical protein VE173_13395, partial [Longimicrobiales bacterium]|nr:hypothetical protein [Longimicrobiales bacterium]
MKAFLRGLVAASLVVPVAASALRAQKRPLDHDAYDLWKRIQGEVLSPDGQWLAYAVVPGDGDGQLLVRRVPEGSPLVVARGSGPTFTDDSRFVVFTIEPLADSVEAAGGGRGRGGGRGAGGGRGGRGGRRGGSSAPPGPADTLGILAVGATDPGDVVRIPRLQSFQVPEEGPAMVAYLLEREEAAEAEEEEPAAEEPGKPAEEEEQEAPQREKAEGSTLVLRELDNGTEHRFEDVTEYAFTEDGAFLYYAASNEDGTADGVYRVETSS